MLSRVLFDIKQAAAGLDRVVRPAATAAGVVVFDLGRVRRVRPGPYPLPALRICQKLLKGANSEGFREDLDRR